MSTLLYNPDRKNKEQLISEFVVRTQVYEEIMHDLETSKMEHPEQHYLLVGQRGAGKTTLLNRLKYGIQDSAELKGQVIPILFSEEQYNITELANLWENIGEYLEDYNGFTGLYEEVEKHIEKKNFEELSYDVLERYLQKHNKRLVLLIDNIGDLLKKLDQIEVRRLREILQTKKEIRLIAGSPFYLETILDYHQPLFEFFKVIRLDGLDSEETKSLLLKLGEIYDEKEKIDKIINETPERIETLRTLTGGVPRTIALMYRIFTEYNDESTIKDLERILDAVTPLYKHRMDDLPVQQQKIVDAVARSWDAISVKDLKNRVRIDSKNISAQLRQLEKNQVIEKKETGTKNHLYFLKERFFNIWYLMRYGRKDDKQRVIWLVRFLESWCDSKDLEFRILHYIDRINSGELDTNTISFYANIYVKINNIGVDVRLLLKKSVPNEIASQIVVPDKEIAKSIKRAFDAEDWNKVLDLALNISKIDIDVESAVYLSISAKLFEIKKSPLYKNLIEKIENINKTDPDEDLAPLLSEGEFYLLKYLLYHQMNYDMLFFDSELVFDHFLTFISFIEEKDLHLKSINYLTITQTLCIALSKGLYNLVYKLFNEVDKFSLKDVFRPVYFAYIYMSEGEKSIEFLKAGPELKESVSDILNSIEEYKIKFKTSLKD